MRHEKQVTKFGDVYVSVDDIEHEELISKIMERIGTLPDRCKEVMYLYLVECKKYKEIAEMLDSSVNTLKHI